MVLEEYVENIKNSLNKLQDVINSKADKNYIGRVNYTVREIGTELQFKSSEFALDSVEKAFEDGEEETNKVLNAKTETKGKDVKAEFADNSVSVNKTVYALNTFTELSKSAMLVTENVLNIVNKVIADNPNITMFKLQGSLQTAMEAEAVSTGTPFNVTFSNGNKVSFESYAKMVARSSVLEAMNVGAFSRASALGNDLVKCTEYGSTCPICSKYEGRVYSISGKSDKYPPLYGTALKQGYSLIHPNCRHEFLPFKEDFYTNEEVSALRNKSNAPFKDDRTEKERTQYAKGQALNQKLRQERIDYDNLKLEQGDNFKYKSIGAYRRATRSKS